MTIDLLVFKINSFSFAVPLATIVHISSGSILQEKKRGRITQDGKTYREIDLYKKFFLCGEEIKPERDYVLFLKNGCFFRTDSLERMPEMELLPVDLARYQEKKYSGFFSGVFLQNGKAGLIIDPAKMLLIQQ